MIGDSVLNAHAALVPLVRGLASGDLTEEEARKRLLRWVGTEARGRSKLSAAAISVLEYALAEEGRERTGRPVGEGAEVVKALRRLKAVLTPPEDGGTPGRPVPAKISPEMLARSPKMRGFRLGEVEILASPESFGWLVTVSHPRRFPTHGELGAAATAVGEGLVFWAHVVPGGPAEPGVGGFVIRLFEDPRRAPV